MDRGNSCTQKELYNKTVSTCATLWYIFLGKMNLDLRLTSSKILMFGKTIIRQLVGGTHYECSR